MKNAKGKRKLSIAFKRIGIFISFILIFSFVAIGVVFIKINNQIDYSADESLFLLSKGSRTTKLYYNAIGEGDFAAINIGREVYAPKEIEDQRVHGAENGLWCKYEDIPENLKNAFLAIEDHRFFEHNGVDWLRTGKGRMNYILQFDSRFGGSTITQQLIKNISDDKDVKVERKLREILRAINIERKFSKEEILELYLNIVPMSENCVGVAAAADVYFGKTVSQLSLAESVCLAAITNSPTYYNPRQNPDKNEYRRTVILQEMLEYGYITQDEYDNAIIESVVIKEKSEKEEIVVHSWYTETVLKDVIDDLMRTKGMSYESAYKTVYSGGLKIYTFMNPQIQNYLDGYFKNLNNFPWECAYKGLQMAMTVVDSKNGNLVAIVGAVGEKKGDRVLSYASEAKMPPGSSIKPLSVYAPAFEEGLITWGTVIDDTPVSFYGKTAWPRNFPSIYSGLTDINTAITQSKNTVAVKVYSMLGAEKSYSYLVNKLGVRSIVRSANENGNKVTDLAVAPLALGQLSYGATVREMTSAYSSFFDGNHRECRSYLAVYDSLGNLILENTPEVTHVWSEQNASIMTQLLQNVVEYGTAKDIKLKYSVDVAGKTGTSGDDRDRWFIGYTPYYTAGIWCGYPDRDAEIGDIKITHLEVWDSVMKKIHKDIINNSYSPIENFRIAQGVVSCSYCKDSGKLFSDNCSCDPRGNRMGVGYFVRSTIPYEKCDCHILVDYDVEMGGVVDISKEEEYYSKEENKDKLKKVALVKETKRDFPFQLYITDAEYIYRPLGNALPSQDWKLPFFSNTVKRGRFIGTTYKKDGKQFNAFCFEHKKSEFEDYEDLDDKGEEKEDIIDKDIDVTLEENNKNGIFIEE